MRNDLILVLSLMAGAASAQDASLSPTDTDAPWPDSAMIEMAASSGSLASSAETDPASNEFTSFSPGHTVGQPLESKLWISDVTAVDGGDRQLIVEPAGSPASADSLFPKLNLFRANTRSLPFYMGIGRPVWFEEYGDPRTGVRAPVGVSLPWRRHRLEFFAEVAPILDVVPTTQWGWTGAVGIRFFLGR